MAVEPYLLLRCVYLYQLSSRYAYRFFLFKIWVFGATQSSKALRESIWFIIINALALFQTLLISIGLTDYVFSFMQFHFYPEDCAHIIGVLFPVFTSFIGHKYLTFKRI